LLACLPDFIVKIKLFPVSVRDFFKVVSPFLIAEAENYLYRKYNNSEVISQYDF